MKVRIVLLADIDERIYQQELKKGVTQEDFLKHLKEDFRLSYNHCKEIQDYEIESVKEYPEQNKCPVCGVNALRNEYPYGNCSACGAVVRIN